jgi:hypothetical protein
MIPSKIKNYQSGIINFDGSEYVRTIICPEIRKPAASAAITHRAA